MSRPKVGSVPYNGTSTDEFGTKYYWKYGVLHRDDGPAIEFFDGAKYYYRNGNLHRDDGPAIMGPQGQREYWLFGKVASIEEKAIIQQKEMT